MVNLKKILAFTSSLIIALTAFSVSAFAETEATQETDGSVSVEIWDGTSDSSLEGAGTADNPYLIKTGAQLYYVTHTTDKTTFDKYYKLVNDIYLNDISDENWYRSESVNKWAGGDTHFGGIFDGDGHVVYGLYTDSENASYSKGGLFPRVYGYNGVTSKQIVIKNLGIEQSYILNSVYSGVIVGQLTGGGGSADLAVAVTIENCYADETVTVSGTKYVGGLVGLLDFKGSFSMNNCYSKVQFGDYPSGWNANEEERNGSLIGWLQNTTESGYTRTVSNCYVVLRREDYEKGYNAVPNITDSVKDSITYTNVHSTNGENSGVQTQHGNAVAGLTSGHWSSDFKGAVAKTKLPAFDWENTWVAGKDDAEYMELRVFVNFEIGDVNCDKHIDILDLVRIKKILVDDGNNYDTKYADLDNSGEIDASDMVELRKILLA